MEIINATDGYKLGHHRMYPEGTEQVYSNWTPRSNKYFPEATEGSVVFGIQYLIKKYLIDEFNQNFFGLPKEKAVEMFYRRVHNFVGIESVGYKHIEALYDLGYLPIRIKALPEGSVCPIRVPMMTITNTKSEFFWLTNYLETLISCTLWMPCTSATRARLYKKELKRHAVHTGFPEDVNLDFLCHDFSMRGMAGLEAAIISGMAHMTSFVGSETIPAIAALEEYYGANSDNELIAATVPAQSNIVFPDHGAKDRYGSNYSHYGYLVFKKERNLETGRIESFEIEESKNCYYSTFVFIDDLCDAGGTFLGELKVLKERYPNSKFIIIVCHVVNDKGLVNMCNNFDQVIVSNSHRDINYRPSNENLTVIDVCK